ncbi:alpha/beta hydrolase family protein [Janthinobacterium agaricidamnosum]|uniref:Putative hydrolase n=1 Tax=Janthinobacterium agaricidamnosum NBRC 102515 = DSM 9628 TaxID=1349767 RepID=W0V5S4_9BURK|nr:alpha/beta fold hydrolase [Janthinobacterium agaricidamnosum]CDG82708.1 putative hydrolase [Janthinobacterium agaricidamnosum NBRC 102515 = DSM 9628]
MTRTSFTLDTADGQVLRAYRYQPQQQVRAEVVIGPAIAVPQVFYTLFAGHLASLGYRVWTFDYRGIGASRSGSLRHCQADLLTWVEQDLNAMVLHASRQVEEVPLFLLGHSLGGQTAPFLPAIRQVAGLINISVGSGAVRHNQPAMRRSAQLLWHVLAPVLCPLFGYFPGKRIGVVGDLPRGVMLQWRRWCLAHDYMLDGEPGARAAYARASYPVLSLFFSDDELLAEAGSRMLHDAYTGTEVDYRPLSPAQFDLPRIGHFGFFKQEQEKILWPLVADWLAQRCPQADLAA